MSSGYEGQDFDIRQCDEAPAQPPQPMQKLLAEIDLVEKKEGIEPVDDKEVAMGAAAAVNAQREGSNTAETDVGHPDESKADAERRAVILMTLQDAAQDVAADLQGEEPLSPGLLSPSPEARAPILGSERALDDEDCDDTDGIVFEDAEQGDGSAESRAAWGRSRWKTGIAATVKEHQVVTSLSPAAAPSPEEESPCEAPREVSAASLEREAYMAELTAPATPVPEEPSWAQAPEWSPAGEAENKAKKFRDAMRRQADKAREDAVRDARQDPAAAAAAVSPGPQGATPRRSPVTSPVRPRVPSRSRSASPAVAAVVPKSFEEADKNGDGVLDRHEYANYRFQHDAEETAEALQVLQAALGSHGVALGSTVTVDLLLSRFEELGISESTCGASEVDGAPVAPSPTQGGDDRGAGPRDRYRSSTASSRGRSPRRGPPLEKGLGGPQRRATPDQPDSPAKPPFTPARCGSGGSNGGHTIPESPEAYRGRCEAMQRVAEHRARHRDKESPTRPRPRRGRVASPTSRRTPPRWRLSPGGSEGLVQPPWVPAGAVGKGEFHAAWARDSPAVEDWMAPVADWVEEMAEQGIFEDGPEEEGERGLRESDGGARRPGHAKVVRFESREETQPASPESPGRGEEWLVEESSSALDTEAEIRATEEEIRWLNQRIEEHVLRHGDETTPTAGLPESSREGAPSTSMQAPLTPLSMPWRDDAYSPPSDGRLSVHAELANATAAAQQAVAEAERNLATRRAEAAPRLDTNKVQIVAGAEADYDAALFDEADAVFDALDTDRDGLLRRQEWIAGSLKGLGDLGDFERYLSGA